MHYGAHSLSIQFITFFFQKNSIQTHQRGYSKVSIKKPKVTCNYNVVSVSDGDSSDSDSSEKNHLIKSKPQRTAC